MGDHFSRLIVRIDHTMMNYYKRLQNERQVSNGFALIATISVMVLLVMIALAMLSLSTVELRSSKRGDAMHAAQANARMALMIAIGELQQKAGPDTRVTAPANIVAGGNGTHKVTGAWRSWEGLDHDQTSGFPGYDSSSGSSVSPPDYSIKTVDYDEDNPGNGRFLGWLVSEKGNWSTTATPQLDQRAQSVPLLAGGTLGDNANGNEIHVIPTRHTGNNKQGSYAWWVSGDNQKANLSEPEPTPGTTEEWDQRLSSAGQPDATFFGLSTPSELSKSPSRESLDLMSKKAGAPDKLAGENFHHLTVHSRGLLTNTATGGWRRDISLMAEQWDTLADSELPFFTLTPGVETSAEKADANSNANHLLYPWLIQLEGGQRPNAVCSWSALRDFATQYRTIQNSSPITMPAHAGSALKDASGGSANISLPLVRDKVTRFPVIARIQWVFAYSSKINPPEDQATGSDTTDDDDYIFCVVVSPVVTLWNPYNVAITVDDLRIINGQMSPLTCDFSLGGVSATGGHYPFTKLRWANGGVKETNLVCRESVDQPQLTFLPGETKIFSPNDKAFIDDTVNVDGSFEGILTSGYRTQGGFRFELHNPNDQGAKITGRGSAVITTNLQHNANIKSTTRGSGIYTSFRAKTSNHASQPALVSSFLIGPSRVADEFWPAADTPNNSNTLLDVLGTSSAFYTTLYGPRLSNAGSKPVKGTLQCNPTKTLNGISWRSPSFYIAKGRTNPINWNESFKFLPLNGWNDPNAPSGLANGSNGYIGESHDAGTGLTRIIMSHIPTRPLQSLAELQHLDIRQRNPVAPYALNLIGNSHAQPLIAANATNLASSDNKSTIPIGDKLQNDDSYIANHLLFDDWFVSSIAPDTAPYSASETRNIATAYNDHLSGATSLPNHRYFPVNGKATDLDTTADWKPWYHIASKLEVHGMFNINSTSVEAWKALLRHLKDADVPHYQANGSLTTDSGTGHPISRSSNASDQEASSSSNSSSDGYLEANQFTGYRRFTDNQIDALAEQIVVEIRNRGPFLSLSEFINRRLTDDSSEKNLARAGVIEAALLNLSERGSSGINPYSELQAESTEITAADLALNINSKHSFTYAAEGYSSYGYPGWTRQADVLRPLAPILSARDDTFTIRAYGDTRDSSGKVIARAWCEAVVKRTANYVDSTDDTTDLPGPDDSGASDSKSVNAINEAFGRRFEITSFRWLNASEI